MKVKDAGIGTDEMLFSERLHVVANELVGRRSTAEERGLEDADDDCLTISCSRVHHGKEIEAIGAIPFDDIG
jgi:hypothetical protein